MGNRWEVATWRALSSHTGEEEAFLRQLWEEVFRPSLGQSEDAYGYALSLPGASTEFHQAHGLPGSVRGWDTVCAALWDNEVYFKPGSRVDKALIPPFPAWMGEWSFNNYVPLPSTWHVLFGAAERVLVGNQIRVRLDAARRHYAAAFDGLLLLLYEPYSSRTSAPPRLPAPGSEGWVGLRKALSFFQTYQHTRIIRHLSEDHGSQAMLVLDYSEEIGVPVGAPNVDERREAFLAKGAAIGRIIGHVNGRDFEPVAREDLVREQDEDPCKILRWLNFVPADVGWNFAEYALTEDEFDRIYQSIVGSD